MANLPTPRKLDDPYKSGVAHARYPLGRPGSRSRRLSDEQLLFVDTADYKRGLRDGEKLRKKDVRKRQRKLVKEVIEAFFVFLGGILVLIVTVLFYAVVVASPFILLALVLRAMGVI
jgi:hypothetical protein